jgi:hypothetical protein
LPRITGVDAFTRKTFIAMVEGAAEPALRLGLIDQVAWDDGIADPTRSAEDDGTFCYTFFKAASKRPASVTGHALAMKSSTGRTGRTGRMVINGAWQGRISCATKS